MENSTAMITPAIKLNSLIVNGIASTNNVAMTSTVIFNLVSGSDIMPSSKIVVDIPTMSYSRVGVNGQDCSYSIGGVSYGGCQFGMENG